jgi:hypothetical protein
MLARDAIATQPHPAARQCAGEPWMGRLLVCVYTLPMTHSGNLSRIRFSSPLVCQLQGTHHTGVHAERACHYKSKYSNLLGTRIIMIQ